MYVAGADRAKVDFAVEVSRREHDKHAAAFAVATCRAKLRFASGITDDARAIVAQNASISAIGTRSEHLARFPSSQSNFIVVCTQMRVQNQPTQGDTKWWSACGGPSSTIIRRSSGMESRSANWMRECGASKRI